MPQYVPQYFYVPVPIWGVPGPHAPRTPAQPVIAPERRGFGRFINDGWVERLGEREWWDFTGESRLLAWALAHTGLLEGLGRILREPLMPSALTIVRNSPRDRFAIAKKTAGRSAVRQSS